MALKNLCGYGIRVNGIELMVSFGGHEMLNPWKLGIVMNTKRAGVG